MSWTVTPSGGSAITFPMAPNDIQDSNPAVTTSFPISGTQSGLINEGLDLRVLTWKGSFYVKNQNKSYLDTNYTSPLLTALKKMVTLATPLTRYNGVWLLDKITVDDKAEGLLARFTYTLVFKQGSFYTIL